ncbi:hypothetical protein OXR01_13900, partial [Staphylococcus gallinarum]|nr:hypothetical protein [Staphylococcus gallinarum]
MKIKTKKQMTQEEYAKYLVDKYGVSGFESELIDDNIVDAPMKFKQVFELNPVSKKDLPNGSFRNGKFTIEVEETVTEDTVIPEMLEISLDKERGINLTDIHRNQSINNVKSDSKFGYETLSLHVINDDCTHTLIWTSEKGLVE